MSLIGVTGGIGTGKSTVLMCLRDEGYRTADADSIVHGLYRPGGDAARALADRWGTEILRADGSVDRAAVARIVFGDASERQWLNGLIHPRVRDRLKVLTRAAAGPLYCAVPLLYEVGWERDADAVVVVWCDPATQAERLRSRGLSPAEIDARIRVQMSTDEKLARADYGIISIGSMACLRRQVHRLTERLAGRFQ